MKFTPEVIAALAILRNAAENDFERHRLDVLKRDLTAPPKVEVIDDNHQRFNGEVYHKSKDGHYVNGGSISRDVYSYYFGSIPAEHDIHHQDVNPSNNEISNLCCLSKSAHHKLHITLGTCQKPYKEKKCKQCGRIFFSQNAECAKFCSKECKSTWRKKFSNPKICPVCGKNFITDSHSETTCCSRSCAAKLRWKKRTRIKEKICPICHKKFEPKDSRTKCCSRSCSSKLSHQTAIKNLQLLRQP